MDHVDHDHVDGATLPNTAHILHARLNKRAKALVFLKIGNLNVWHRRQRVIKNIGF